jgi:ATP-dependent exoDNAse (exonuclease V) alpha subunit
VLPADFKAWTYGHALTSYRAQGSTAEESFLVLGEVAERALMRRQFYVGNTRYRGSHRIYVSHRDAILARLARPDPGRELATEFAERNRLMVAERIAPGPIRRLRSQIRQTWLSLAGRRQAETERQGEKV